MAEFKAGIVGATGYTGSELVRLLAQHTNVTIEFVTSESYKGQSLAAVHPHLHDTVDITLISASEIDDYNPDVLFLALPHGVSVDYVKKLSDRAFSIVVLSGDFRFKAPAMYVMCDCRC